LFCKQGKINNIFSKPELWGHYISLVHVIIVSNIKVILSRNLDILGEYFHQAKDPSQEKNYTIYKSFRENPQIQKIIHLKD
jgi:hypothetical protein